MRGIYLVEGHHWEVITFAIGNSAETLYLYWMGLLVRLMGPTTLAVQLASWPFALAIIWMVWRMTRRLADTVPPWIPALTAASSVWLFHFARSGPRSITAPFFLAAFTLLLDRVERRPRDRWAGLLCGAVLGLSLYGYTSSRVLPIAFLAYALFRLLRARGEWRPPLLRYATVAAGAAAASIPNLLFFLHRPAEFLGRGNYVLVGGGTDRALHMLWTVLLPWYFPDAYRIIEGPFYAGDGISAALVAAGLNPLNIVIAVAMLPGLWCARRILDRPVAGFLLAAWITATLLLGIAGPSPAHLLVILPAYLVFAALGFGYAWEAWPRLRMLVPLALLAVVGMDGYTYFSDVEPQVVYYGAAATPLGQKAAQLAAQGHRVLCVLSKDAGVVNYLAHGLEKRVRVAEFFHGPLDVSQFPLRELQPDVLLVDDAPKFRAFTARLPRETRTCQEERFSCYSLPGT